MPDCAVKSLQQNAKPWYPFDHLQNTKPYLMPEDIAPPDDEQPPALALAVQYTDIDFCSAPCVRAFVEDFFTG